MPNTENHLIVRTKRAERKERRNVAKLERLFLSQKVKIVNGKSFLDAPTSLTTVAMGIFKDK